MSVDDSRDQLPPGLSPAGADRLSNAAFASDLAPQVDDPEESRRRLARIRDNQADVNVMIAKNKEEMRSTRRVFYAGYRLIRAAAKPTPQEEPYIDAFLPLAVAKEHPELLGLPTLHYRTVYSNEKLRRATKTIVAPGVFAKSTGNRKLICLLGVVCCAIVVAVIYAAWTWRSSR